MKTTERLIKKNAATQIYGSVKKAFFFMLALLGYFSTIAQNAPQTITITESKFANLLVEKWVGEYTKANPDITFRFVKNSDQAQSDLSLTVNIPNKAEGRSNKNQVTVGRVAILPIANEKNSSFEKQLKNGIKQQELKSIFLRLDQDLFDSEGETANEPLYTVYTQTPGAATAQVLLNHFGQASSDLNGVIVTGDDKYLLESVLVDSTGVTYSNLGQIYDLNKRTPIHGIKILPIDPDDNGRLKKEELIYNNLDQLITFLEASKSKTIPTDDVSFSYNKKNNNPLVEDFVNWVANSGQKFNHQYGFLRSDEEIDRTLTQK